MPFLNYKNANLAKWQLLAGISASATSMILQSAQGWLFPAVFPYLLKLEQYDATSPLENKPVLKREMVRVTNKAWDTFTIVRSAWSCPVSDVALTQTTTALAFNSLDSVSLVMTNEQQEDVQEEIERLETDKANDNVVVKLTGNQTIAGIKTFSNKPQVPTGTTGLDAVNKAQLDADILSASAVESLNDRDTYRLWEDVVASNSLFVEDIPTIASITQDISVSDNFDNDTHNSSSATTAEQWVIFTAIKDIRIKTATIYTACTATRALLKDADWNILETVSIVSKVATFSWDTYFGAGQSFIITCDASGGSYTQARQNPAWYPLTRTNLIATAGIVSSWALENIITVVTEEKKIELVWNVAGNRRFAIPIIGTWIPWDTFELSLRKYVSPGVDFNFRIETSTAFAPSGTEVETATVTSASLTTSLVATVVTLGASVTLTLWQIYWIVWYPWVYGSETINGTNYFGVWYVGRNTTTRGWKRRNGTARTALSAALVTDIDNLAFTSTNAAVTQRWYRMQAIAWLALTTITKSASCTATRVLVKTDANVTLQTLTFSWNVATLTTPQVFQTGEFFRLECDSNAVSFTSHRLLSATFPQTRTNVVYTSGSEAGSSAWASGTTAFNIDSVGTELLINNFAYLSSTLSLPRLLSKTNATFSYKLPTDLPRIATEAKSAGSSVIATTLWLNSTFSGMTPLADMFISNTAWAISSTRWEYTYKIWQVIDGTNLFVTKPLDEWVYDYIQPLNIFGNGATIYWMSSTALSILDTRSWYSSLLIESTSTNALWTVWIPKKIGIGNMSTFAQVEDISIIEFEWTIYTNWSFQIWFGSTNASLTTFASTANKVILNHATTNNFYRINVANGTTQWYWNNVTIPNYLLFNRFKIRFIVWEKVEVYLNWVLSDTIYTNLPTTWNIIFWIGTPDNEISIALQDCYLRVLYI